MHSDLFNGLGVNPRILNDTMLCRLPIDVCDKCHSAVIKGDRGLTEVTPNDVLETVLGVHDLGALYQLTVVHAGKNYFIRIRLLLLIKVYVISLPACYVQGHKCWIPD